MKNANKQSRDHQIAIVTGGSSGIGFAIASKLIRNGIFTIIVSRSQAKMNSALQKLENLNKDFISGKIADVSNKKEIYNCIKEIHDEYGKIDYLINSAGVSIHGSFSELQERDWDEVVDINLKGTFLACKAVWPYMIEDKSSKRQIITISSASGLSGYSGGSIYCASKFGVNGLMEALLLEGQEVGIKISTIIPGPVDTAIWNSDDELVNEARPKMLNPESIADMVHFIMSSPENSHFRFTTVHPFAIQPYLKGRNRGPGGNFPTNPNKLPSNKNKTFRI